MRQFPAAISPPGKAKEKDGTAWRRKGERKIADF
jgi:hypothetical protein